MVAADEKTFQRAMGIVQQIVPILDDRDSDEVLTAMAYILGNIFEQVTTTDDELRTALENFVTSPVEALKTISHRFRRFQNSLHRISSPRCRKSDSNAPLRSRETAFAGP